MPKDPEILRARCRAYYANNKDKVKARVKETRKVSYAKLKDDPEYKKKMRWQYIKYTYGLSQAEYETMLKNQNNKCSLCGLNFYEDEAPHIDHDHTTGKIRALLHNKCNLFIGLADEDPELLRLGIVYLQHHKSN